MSRVRLTSLFLPVVCLVVVFAVVFLPLRATANTEVSPWLQTSNPQLKEVAANQSPQVRANYNRDCTPETGITRKARPSSVGITELKVTGCTSYSNFGAFNSDYLRLNNTGLYGKTVYATGGSFGVMPIPNSSTVLFSTSNDGFSAIVNIVKNFPSLLKTRVLIDGRIEHVAQPFTPKQLKDKSGNIIRLNFSSMAFSKNGEWLLANSPYWGAVRVNLKTFEVLPFDKAFNYFGGIAPAVQNAISSDGRYAVVSSGNFYRFKIYDLSTCASVPNTIAGPVTCQSKDLYPFMLSQASGYFDATEIRFISNTTFRFYGSHLRPGTSAQTNLYTLTAPGQTEPTFEYLGLGDSFASGEGAYDYRDGTDTSINKCHTSIVSYPYLISSSLNFNTGQSVACSGATINDYVGYEEEEYKGQVKDNIPYKDRDEAPILQNYEPGYIAQKIFVEKSLPSIITISAVGNDIGFSNKIKRCLEPDTCFSSYEDRLEIVRETNNQFDRLVGMYKDLLNSTLPGSKIYVIGYPQIAKENGDCAINVHLNNDEIIFANQLVDYLNSVIQKATLKAGVTYVDVSQAFIGSRLCETESKSTAVNGLTAGNDIIELLGGPIGNESYHPNALGHRLFKDVILAQTDNLTKANPRPDSTVQNPTDSSTLPILQAPKTNRQIYTTNYDNDMANNVLVRGAWYDITKTYVSAIAPLSNVVFWLNSDPVNLGTFQTDATGGLAARIQIPESVPPGFHTLHAQGTNVAGEPVDFYKTVYVAASNDDLDGDGTQNTDDPCAVVEPSGQDIDQDGTDDACDGIISDPPPPEEPTTIGADDNKPPENNPETEAGNERTPELEPTIGTATTELALNNSPQNITSARPTTGSPILQSAVLSSTEQKPPQTTQDGATEAVKNLATTRKATNTPWLILAAIIILTVPVLTAHKLLKTP